MNKLERAILEGARNAQKEYVSVTAGLRWLSHGPESFIEHPVAIRVAKDGFCVFPEASPKKILKEQGIVPRGRPAGNLGQRFDLVVWFKDKNEVRAIIEIKRAWAITNLRGDKDKVAMCLEQGLTSAGYLLVYTEARGPNRLENLSKRLNQWAVDLECTLVGEHVETQGDGTWNWCFGLFKVG